MGKHNMPRRLRLWARVLIVLTVIAAAIGLWLMLDAPASKADAPIYTVVTR
jgi:hypothetical protein